MAYFFRRPPRFQPRYLRFQNPGGLLISAHVFSATDTVLPSAFADVRSTNGTYIDPAGIRQTAGPNALRYDNQWNGTSWVPYGLLVEPAATNLILSPNAVGDANWTKTLGAASSLNNARSKDGTTNATLFSDGGAGNSQWFQGFTATAAQHVAAFDVLPGTCTALQVGITGGGFSGVNFDLTNGTVNSAASGYSGYVIPLGSGWYRVFSVSPVLTAGTNYLTFNAGAGTLWLAAAQAEVGTIGTSFTTSTRNADSISFTLGSSTNALRFTFDDSSTQTITGLTPGSTYTIPTTLNRQHILLIDDVSTAGVSAALAVTEVKDVAAFVATVGDNAVLTATEAADVAAFVATLTDNAALAATEAQDVAAFVAIETDTAVLAATEVQDVAAFVVTPKINAALAVTEAQDVAAFVISNSAVLAATEAQDVAAFVVIETDTAVLAATEAQDSAAFAVTIPDNAALAATEAADVAAFVVAITDQAALAATEAQDVAAFVAIETDTAVLTATEGQDVAAFVASIKINAALATTEAADTAAIVASVGDNAALAATEAQDVALINASGSDVAVLAATEAQDTAALVAQVSDTAALAVTELSDVASVVASVGNNAALAANEAQDSAAILLPAVIIAALAATEDRDAAGFAAVIHAIQLPPLPPDPRPSHGMRRLYAGHGAPAIYGTDIYGTPIYGAAGTLSQPLRQAPPPEVRRVYAAAGVPGLYGADIFGGGAPGPAPEFSSADFSGDFARTGTPATAGSGTSIYGAAGALNKPLRRTTGPQMRRTYKYPAQLIPGGIYEKDIYYNKIYQSDS